MKSDIYFAISGAFQNILKNNKDSILWGGNS